jgi:signal transduction histidine kinase
VYEGLGDKNGLAITLDNIGTIHRGRGEPRKALDFHRRSLRYSREIGDSSGTAGTYTLMGAAYSDLNRPDSAAAYLLQSLAMARAIGHQELEVQNLMSLGNLYLDAGRFDRAARMLRAGLALAHRIQARAEAKDLHYGLARLAAARGDHRSAFLDLKRYAELKDSLFAETSQRQIQELEIKYQSAKKEQENELLKHQNALKQSTIARQRTAGAAILLVGALAAALAAVFFRSRQRQKRMNLLLQTANEELLRLSRFKEGLTGMIVHDLKNPLGNILYHSEGKQDRTMALVHRSARQMLNLVLNILDVQRFEDAEMKLKLETVPARGPADRAIEETAALALEKGIRVRNAVEPGLAARMDAEIVQRVFVNLLTNAVKYTPNNGAILVSAESLPDGRVRFSVADNGEGIPPELQFKIFDRFHQADARRSGKSRATGLGLTFCKLAVEAHGGRIGVESEVGKGAAFWFTLPMGRIPAHGTASPGAREATGAAESAFVWTDVEKKTAAAAAERLRRFEVYEISNIRAVLRELDAGAGPSLRHWKATVEAAAYACNAERYRDLTGFR